MATLAPSPSGGAIGYTAAAGGGDKYLNSGRERVHVRNGGVGSITVHLTKTALCNLGVVHTTDVSDDFTVAPGADKLLPAVSPSVYNDGSGFVGVAYSGVTSVTVGVIA